MQDPPDLKGLIDSARRFLEEEIVPAVGDPRLRFRARVAANVLAVAARERELEEGLLLEERRRLAGVLGREGALAGGPEAARRPLADLRSEVEEWNAELARRIRAGAIDAAPGSPAWKHLKAAAVEKLQVASPACLERKKTGPSREGGAGR
jgi:hypothetical protein